MALKLRGFEDESGSVHKRYEKTIERFIVAEVYVPMAGNDRTIVGAGK